MGSNSHHHHNRVRQGSRNFFFLCIIDFILHSKAIPIDQNYFDRVYVGLKGKSNDVKKKKKKKKNSFFSIDQTIYD
jgi:hypothetical protein